MKSKNKLGIILSELDIKAPTFAKNIGLQYQRIFDIQRGKTKKISGEIAQKINSAYPQFPIDWLLSDTQSLPQQVRNMEQKSEESLDILRKEGLNEYLKAGSKDYWEKNKHMTQEKADLFDIQAKSYAVYLEALKELMQQKGVKIEALEKIIKKTDDFLESQLILILKEKIALLESKKKKKS